MYKLARCKVFINDKLQPQTDACNKNNAAVFLENLVVINSSIPAVLRVLFSIKYFTNCEAIIVTGPEKTGLIYIKYTYSYYGAYLSFYTLYLNSVNFNEQLRIFCTCYKICMNILCLK